MTTPLPLVYLHTASQGISGSIRFQKLVFLGQQESEIQDTYRFVPYKYGPYSYQLERDIETWRNEKCIQKTRTKNEMGNYRVDYSLTPKGIRTAKSLLSREIYETIFKEVDKITSKYANQRLSNLIKYVYGNYPDYTDESTLDIDLLFDESTTSQFAKPDSSQVGPFNQIEKLDEEEGTLSGIDKEFTRHLLDIGPEFRATLERISGDSISIYWRSPLPSFDSFVQAVRQDPRISEDAASEYRSVDSDEWINGESGELLSTANKDTCLFFRTEADGGQYTVTWEKGLGDEGDEITLQMMEDQADYKLLRAALVQYATATAFEQNISRKTRLRTNDDLVSESFRQTAKLAIS